ncbi:MAG: choice-of-anchor D domain-containing protein [Bryobacteraceae bacterium]|nr:choice-of-anchor D domain-containing protein [Bryobacteraceae bacterium]
MRLFFLFAPIFSLQAQINFPPDLSISRLEVVQTIQDDDQSVPLIAGKATAVRAFLRQQGRPENLVTGASIFLRGFRGGAELAGSPLRAINGVITASLEPDRENPLHSLDFILPADWTLAGSLELRAELRLAPGTVEGPADNNNRQLEVRFAAAPMEDFRVAWLPVCITAECPAAGFQHQGLARRLMPLADGRLSYEDVPAPPLIWTDGVAQASGGQGLLNLLRKWRLFLEDSALQTSFVVGWLPRGTQASDVAARSVNDRVAWIVEQPAAFESQRLLFQQMVSSPVSGGCEATIGQPGYDPLAARMVPSSRANATARCEGITAMPWLSASDAATYTLTPPSPRGALREDTLIVSGKVGRDGSGSLDPAYRSRSAVLPPVSENTREACLVVTSGGGETSHCFFPFRETADEASFAFRLPAAGVTAVRLLRNDTEVASLSFSGQSPEVSLSAVQEGEQWTGRRTLEWTASDAAGRALTFALFYSIDDGANWIPLALDLRDPSYAVDTQYLLPGTVRFRVMASAGLDIGQGESAAVVIPQAARVRLADAALSFGNATTGQISERLLLMENTGASPLEVTAPQTAGEPFLISQPLPMRVRAGVQQGLAVRYRPRIPGSESSAMTIGTSDPDNPNVAVSLRASAFDRQVPNALLLTTALEFGQVEVGQTRELGVVLRNEGTAPLLVNGLSTLNARFSAVSPGNFSVAPGEGRVIAVRFSPFAGGAQSGSLNIATNDPTTPTLRVELRGAGFQTFAPVIEVSPTVVNFGSLALGQSSPPLAVTVRNAGNGMLSINALPVSNPAFALLSPASLPVLLEPGRQQVISLRYAPSALGAQSGTLAIESSDPARPRVTVELNGTGVAVAASAVPQISSVAPATLRPVPAGYNVRFNVTVNGANFSSGAKVYWNGEERPTEFVSPFAVKGSLSAADVAMPGDYRITVVNPPPGGGTSAAATVAVTGEPAGGVVSTAQIHDVNTQSCPAVTLTLSAINRIGLAISTSNSSNLALFDGGVTCREDSAVVPCSLRLARESGSLLSAVMIFHTSASQADRQNFMKNAGLQFVNSMPVSMRALVTYMDNGVRLSQDTVDFKEGVRNVNALQNAVNRISTPLALGSGTALYDAIEDALNRLSGQDGRKAIILFAASENTYDTHGPRDVNALLQRVRNSAVPMYVIPVGDGLSKVGLISALHQFAADSGGRVLIDRGSSVSLQLSRLTSELSDAHLVNFGTLKQDGLPHRIQIDVAASDGLMRAVKFYPGCRAR